LIEAIQALPPEKQKRVEAFVHGLNEEEKAPHPKISFEEAANRVFTKHATLLKELAK